MKTWLRLLTLLLLAAPSFAADPPKPYGPVPSERQLRWHELGAYGFVHFGLNTFTGREWGYGDEPESLFNPTDFSADQIAQAARDAGLKGLMFTCKHHDGFCLWPSKFTEHNISRSPYKGGKGDLVREIADACRRHGLLFGVYLSPWDRNRADYGTPAYIDYYRNQLRELLTNYGPIFEMWFDGANGGDGFYGGAREKRKIDNRSYYDWENTWKIVRELQPQACMFSDGGPDVRWCGNEKGFAGDPCWAAVNRAEIYPGVQGVNKLLNNGRRDGSDWLPAEVDVSIRPGWFYHASEDKAVKTPEQLIKIYFESVGRGANLILNLPPDQRGRIHEIDVKNLRQWRAFLDATFAADLARGARAWASNTRGRDFAFAARNVLDGDPATYWATDDVTTEPTRLALDFGKPVTFNVVRLREYLPLGQRVEAFALDRFADGQWVQFAAGSSIGNQRLIPLERPVTASRIRLRIDKAPVCPAISELAVFHSPTPLPAILFKQAEDKENKGKKTEQKIANK